MALHSEPGECAVRDARDREVVQVAEREPQVGSPRNLVVFPTAHGKAVILRSDLHLLVVEVLHGMVPTVVSERELERSRPKRAADQLMPQTDAKYRDVRPCQPHPGASVIDQLPANIRCLMVARNSRLPPKPLPGRKTANPWEGKPP